MLPAVAQAGLADAVDGFMEGIAFSKDQTARVFRAARRLDCRSSCMRISCRTWAEQHLLRNFLLCPLIIWSTQITPASRPWRGQIRWQCFLPGAFYFIRETTKPPVELFRTTA